MAERFRVVALDADDTLWHNEPLFSSAQARLHELLQQYHDPDWIDRHLYETERRNLEIFGYGVKGFVLSMVETAIDLTEGRITGSEIRTIVELGHEMLRAPVRLLEGVEETVRELARRYTLMLLTKGDLLDQESKLARSGLGELFSAVEVVSEKDARTYRAVLERHRLEAGRFVMVGDSLRSDVLPVLEAGGSAVHVPYETSWVHERVAADAVRGREFVRLGSLRELPEWLGRAE